MPEINLRLISVPQAPQRDGPALEFARAEFVSESMLLFQSLLDSGSSVDLLLESQPHPAGFQPSITYRCESHGADWAPLIRGFRYLRLEPHISKDAACLYSGGRRIRRRLHLAPAGNFDVLREDTGKVIPRLGSAVGPHSLYFLPIPRPIAPINGLQRWTRTLALLNEAAGYVRLRAARIRPTAREQRDIQLWLNLFNSAYWGRLSDQQLAGGLRVYRGIAAGDPVCTLEIEAWPDAVARAFLLDHDPDALEMEESDDGATSAENLPEAWQEPLRRIRSYWLIDEALHLVAPPVTFGGSLGGVLHHVPSPFPSPAEPVAEPGQRRLSLGTSVNGKPVAFDVDDLARHVFVTGTTGSGKSHTVRHLLQQIHRMGVPFLVIDPAKRDYAGWMQSIGIGNAVIRFNTDGQRFNPLLPPDSVSLYNHSVVFARILSLIYPTTPAVYEILLAMTRATYLQKLGREWQSESLPQNFESTRLLMKLTGADILHRPKQIPSFAEFLSTGALWLKEFGGSEKSQWTRDVIDHFERRWQLLRTSYLAWLFSPIEPNRRMDNFFRISCIMELAEQTDPVESNVLMALVLARLCAQRMNEPAANSLRHVTVIEEAHRIIPRQVRGWSDDTVGSPEQALGELFARMLAEIRISGEGIVVVEQSAGKILPDVLINSSTKIVHTLLYGPDQSLIATAHGLGDEEARYLATLKTGQAILTHRGYLHPVEVKVDG